MRGSKSRIPNIGVLTSMGLALMLSSCVPTLENAGVEYIDGRDPDVLLTVASPTPKVSPSPSASPSTKPSSTPTPTPTIKPSPSPSPQPSPQPSPSPSSTSASTYGKQTAVRSDTTRFGSRPFYGYYEYLPAKYAQEPGKKWPLIVFLHGQGELGNGTTELGKVLATGLPQVIEQGKFPAHDQFIVISPQTWAYFTPSHVRTFMDFIRKNYPIDEDRMYLTGLSYGSFGLFDYVKTYGSGTEFAAVAPISGNGNGGDHCQFKTIPLWAFHGGKDSNVATHPSASIDPVNKINNCGPVERAQVTIFSNTGHGANTWNAVYDGSGMNIPTDAKYDPFSPDLYTWFLQHSK